MYTIEAYGEEAIKRKHPQRLRFSSIYLKKSGRSTSSNSKSSSDLKAIEKRSKNGSVSTQRDRRGAAFRKMLPSHILR